MCFTVALFVGDCELDDMEVKVGRKENRTTSFMAHANNDVLSSNSFGTEASARALATRSNLASLLVRHRF
jgi:hypothetical protein